MYNLDKRYENIKLIFKEDGHKYNDSLGRDYVSATTFISNYIPKFDTNKWSRYKAKELGISIKEVKNNWNNITTESCDRGNKTHNYLEDGINYSSKFSKSIQYLNAKTDGTMITVADIPSLNVTPFDIKEFIDATENKYSEIYKVFNYYLERDYVIYAELGAFLLDYLISGMIDVPVIREDQFVILDWKTNKDGLIFESGYYKKDKKQIPHQKTNNWIRTNDKMLSPLNHLPECNGSHYNMQLSLYAYMVESILRIPCAGIGLCHIQTPFIMNEYNMPLSSKTGNYTIDQSKNETVSWHKMPYLKKEIQSILNDRKKELIAKGLTETQLTIF